MHCTLTARAVRLVSMVLILAVAAPAAAQDKMINYHLVLLKKGPAQPSSQDAEIQKQHIAHLEKLGADGYGMAAGPFGDDGDIRGIVVLKVASAAQARELTEQDPAVKAGRLTVEVMTFLSPEGWFGKPAQPIKMEQLAFGFLVAGPNRSQDKETAQQLQKEHLAYMDARHKEGKLLVAGPIVENGGDRRGIVIYRTASFDEAKQVAEGDPMVKAGRLVVDLHPLYLPVGVLK
jgi:uncharacterized protein YciI